MLQSNFGSSADLINTIKDVMVKSRNMSRNDINEHVSNDIWKIISETPTSVSVIEKQSKRRFDVTIKEEQELDELSKKTLGSYAKKATYDATTKAAAAERYGQHDLGVASYKKSLKRKAGISKAVDKLTKEEQELDEVNIDNTIKDIENKLLTAKDAMKAATGHSAMASKMNTVHSLTKQLLHAKKRKAQLGEAKDTKAEMDDEDGDGKKDKKKKLTKIEKCDTIDTSPSDNKTMVQTKEATMLGLKEAGKWNYPADMTKTKEISDMGTTNAAKNREKRKEWRKKHKALQHKKLVQTKEARMHPNHEETIIEIAGKKLTSFEKEKFYELKKKHENNKMHRLLRKQYGDKGDDIFHGKLIKMAKGSYDGTHSKNEEFEFTAEDFNNFDELAVIGRGEDLDELSKKTLGSYVKKASHDVATKAAATGRYAERANKASDDIKASGDYSKYTQKRKDDETADKMFKKSWKRRLGIGKAIDKMTKEEFELREAEAVKRGRGRPRKDAAMTNDTTDSGDRHIVSQMRKAVSLNGNHVIFNNGEKKHIDRVAAQGFLNKYADMHKPAHREIFANSAIKSLNHFNNALKGKVEAPKKRTIEMPKLKSDVMG